MKQSTISKFVKGLLVGIALAAGVTILLMARPADAGERSSPTGGGTGIGVGIGTGGAGGAGGDATGTGVGGNSGVDIRNPLQFPVANTATAPNVTMIGCPPLVVGSEAHQNWIFGKSGTTVPVLIPFCAALALNQLDVAEQIICNASKDYRKANDKCLPNAADVE